MTILLMSRIKICQSTKAALLGYSISYRLALNGFSEELTCADKNWRNDKKSHRPFVVKFKREIVDGDFADSEKDFSGSFSYADRGGHALKSKAIFSSF